MTYQLLIKEEAHLEAQDAYLYYEQKQPGLGERFLTALEKRYADLASNPEYYSYISDKDLQLFRDIKLANFPYVVIYEILDQYVIIYSIHATHKKPSS